MEVAESRGFRRPPRPDTVPKKRRQGSKGLDPYSRALFPEVGSSLDLLFRSEGGIALCLASERRGAFQRWRFRRTLGATRGGGQGQVGRSTRRAAASALHSRAQTDASSHRTGAGERGPGHSRYMLETLRGVDYFRDP